MPPTAARRELEAVGIKLPLAQWEQLRRRGDRLMICHAPADSEKEQSALRNFIEEVALAPSGFPAKISATTRAAPLNHPPPALVQHLRAFGIELEDMGITRTDSRRHLNLEVRPFKETW